MTSMAVPDDSEVALINQHGQKHFGGMMECRRIAEKGRVLHSTRVFQAGDLILIESPLHVVQEEPDCDAYHALEQLCSTHKDDFDFEPLWYWCALRSLTTKELSGAAHGGWQPLDADKQQALLLLHREDEPLESKPGSSAAILARELAPGASAKTIEALTQAWVLNCFDFSDDPQGYCTYFYSSFMSHSCIPNAFWYYEGDKHVLRARSDIAVGDEVCISYLSEDWLLRSAPERRWDLHSTKHFWCTCHRCNGESDLSRGFVCPRCRSGTVFGPAPGCGPAKSQLPPRGDLFTVVCGKCGHRITKAEAAKLTAQEKALQTLVVGLDSAFDQKYATEVSDFIEAVFAQHWLADVAWERLLDFYQKGAGSKQRRTEQCELLQRRCKFHAAAYPGNSGTARMAEGKPRLGAAGRELGTRAAPHIRAAWQGGLRHMDEQRWVRM